MNSEADDSSGRLYASTCDGYLAICDFFFLLQDSETVKIARLTS